MKAIVTLLLFVVLTNNASGQRLLKKNEQVIFSFTTTKGKKVMLARDKAEKHIVYRYGSNQQLEFEYPKPDTDTCCHQFTYSTFFRPDYGKGEGLDMHYLEFVNNGYKYILYKTWFGPDRKPSFGLRVINLSNDQTTQYPARKGSVKDNWDWLSNNDLVEQTTGSYD